ncbi:hypothetical protein QTO34_005413 [Cnephaeus nilssonii]|uniref:Uncharacterized protein n=1 Tax=Cnephaeus nilssonii TaxID=3371016 RepID=A0AA40LJZ2_CNENI|nr:hypothetical protein QTO34_005413 [Eptesicus nilssonii]
MPAGGGWRRSPEPRTGRASIPGADDPSERQRTVLCFSEGRLEAWLQPMQRPQHSPHSPHVPERDGAMLLRETLGEVGSPGLLSYSVRSDRPLTDDCLQHGCSPPPCRPISVDEAKACEALEALDELLESEMPVIERSGMGQGRALSSPPSSLRSPHSASGWLETWLWVVQYLYPHFLVRVKSKALLKNHLLPPCCTPFSPLWLPAPLGPAGSGGVGIRGGRTGDWAGRRVIQALCCTGCGHVGTPFAPKKPFSPLMPMLEEAWQSDNPHQRQAGLLVLAALSVGAGDHGRQRLLPPRLQIVCKGLEDPLCAVLRCLPWAGSQRPHGLLSAADSGEGMPLLLAELKSVSPGRTHHLARACYPLKISWRT